MSHDTTMEPTPGRDRVLRFTIRGHEFGFRRPSRADRAAAALLESQRRTFASGDPNRLLAEIDPWLRWECILEVGFLPRRNVNNQVVQLGERLPPHWLEWMTIGENQVPVFSLAQVDPEEFEAVVAYVSDALEAQKKKASAPEDSTASAPASTSGPSGGSGSATPAPSPGPASPT